ncbi:MAG: hypothetical protein U0931_00850 [Vulcanimicrobiota bacterium]
MKNSSTIGLLLILTTGLAVAEPQAKVRKLSDNENSYTYYNWRPNRPKPPAPAQAPVAPASPTAAAPTAGYAPWQPNPALLNPSQAPQYNPGYNLPPAQPVAPPMNYAPQSYYSSPYFSSGYYNGSYSYPGLQVSNSGFYNGLSISGVYRNGNVTVRAGSPGYFPGFYGPGFQGGGGFHHGGGRHR